MLRKLLAGANHNKNKVLDDSALSIMRIDKNLYRQRDLKKAYFHDGKPVWLSGNGAPHCG